MTSLAHYDRDRCLPLSAGELGFELPSDEELLSRFADPLRALLGGEPAVGAELEHARWKPGISVAGSWRVWSASGDTTYLCLKRYAGDKASERAERTSATPGFWAFPERKEVAFGPAADLGLPGLGRALGGNAKRQLTRLVSDAGLIAPGCMRKRASSLTILRYKPERRAVCRLDARLRGDEHQNGTLRLALRVLPPGVAVRVTTARAALASCTHLAPQPTVRFSVPRLGWLAEDWLPGEIDEARALAHAAEAGALLRELHDAPLPPPAASVPLQAAACLDLGLFRVRADLHQLATRIQSALPSGTTSTAFVWCHGDFHPDQVLFEDGRARRLLDFDALGVGPRETDLAAWIADELASAPDGDFEQAARALFEGYGPVPLERLRAPVASRLCHLAAGALRRMELGAADKATDLLKRAQELVQA